MLELLEYLGTRPSWDAIAAVGTFLAVAIALTEVTRNGRAERERKQASIADAMVIMNSAAMLLARLEARWRRGEGSPHEICSAAVQLGGLDQLTQPAMAIDLTSLPTLEAIDWVMTGRHLLDVAQRQMQVLAGNRESQDTELFSAQILQLHAVVAGLADESIKFKGWWERRRLLRKASQFFSSSEAAG